jgi:metal-sulfur cluster biosynthetic enzyme
MPLTLKPEEILSLLSRVKDPIVIRGLVNEDKIQDIKIHENGAVTFTALIPEKIKAQEEMIRDALKKSVLSIPGVTEVVVQTRIFAASQPAEAGA